MFLFYHIKYFLKTASCDCNIKKKENGVLMDELNKKSVLIMLDDVVNDFSVNLAALGVEYNPKSDLVTARNYISIFFKDNGDLSGIGLKAFCETKPDIEGIDFVNSLYDNGYAVVLCTSRDIRLCYEETKEWLDKNKVKYTYLFTATAPAGLCIDMDIPVMVYNLPENGEKNINLVGFKIENGKKLPVEIGVYKTFEEAEKCITANF